MNQKNDDPKQNKSSNTTQSDVGEDARIDPPMSNTPATGQLRFFEKRWLVFAAVSSILGVAVGLIVWFVPLKIDRVVERFDPGVRAAAFERAPSEAKEANVAEVKESDDLHLARSGAVALATPPPEQSSPPHPSRLSIRGTGRGGGGTGEVTIGLGALDTIGHGSGGGSSAGYGRGYGALGGRRSGIKSPSYNPPPPYAFLNNPNAVYVPGHNTEAYNHQDENPFLQVASSPLSTFSIDVDTASYANVRRYLRENTPPPKDAVRIEELINYFSYNYPPPTGDAPFSVNIETGRCPWKPEHTLARIGLKGRELEKKQRPPSNLVFLIDVSGSMQPANKLPLLKRALTLLIGELDARDQVSVAVYAGASGRVLKPTPGQDKAAIREALEKLQAGGSTNGGAGIELAYNLAEKGFIKDGVNRVILATDGDFNVGVTDDGSLIRLIKQKAKSGVYLTVLGVGMGNLKDATLEQIADKGNGQFVYIDSLSEARKVLVEQMGGTLVTIAKDVKLQVEFNPKNVGSYRLIGYENRILAARDFNDDKKDAGEIGAGHTVTALYELTPPDTAATVDVDPLKYQSTSETDAASTSNELFTVKLRYKPPTQDKSRLLTYVAPEGPSAQAAPSTDFSLAAAAAGFGMLLKNSPHKGTATFDSVRNLAENSRGEDRNGYRKELVNLIQKAKQIIGTQTARVACTPEECE